MRNKNKNIPAVPERVTKDSEIFFGKLNIKTIEPFRGFYNKKHKIVVFVPLQNADELAFAMASAGAGTIGNYSVCSFRTTGIGTFIGGEGSNPAAGKKGKFEMVEEVRLEMICDAENVDNVINKIYEAHPYEEPAYEIYDISVREKSAENVYSVSLNKNIPVKKLMKRINKELNIFCLPDNIQEIKFKRAVVDYTAGSISKLSAFEKDILYIKKKKNKINIEVI